MKGKHDEEMTIHRVTIEALRRRISKLDDPFVKAILLFGSLARGEAHQRSDIDILVLHEDYPEKDPIYRRRKLYHAVHSLISDMWPAITLIDMDIKNFLKPKHISPLLLNIYWDAVILLDRTRGLEAFLRQVRKRIAKVGLRRVRCPDGRTYHWVFPEPMKEVRII